MIDVGCETVAVIPPGGDSDGTGGNGGSSGGGDGGGKNVSAPQRVCSRVGPSGSMYGYLGENNEVLEYYDFQCTNPDFEYRALVCVFRCPAGYSDPPPPAGPVAGPSPEEVRAAVYARVKPVPPPALVAPEAPVVGVPAFLEVEGFEVRSAADTDGGLAVEVTATPVEVRWTFGDHQRTCSTGGVGFTPERLEQAMAQADGLVDDGEMCTFLFTSSSAKEAGGPLTSSVVTVWDYSWSLNGVDQGVFNAGLVSPPTTFDLTVREYQAVLTE